MKKFPCTKCGLCCMRAGSLENFPHETDHNGVCSKLDKKNMTCTIYEDRPMICRIDDYHKKYLSANVDLSIWHKYNADMCNKMINQAGIDQSYLVKLDTGDISDTAPYISKDDNK